MRVEIIEKTKEGFTSFAYECYGIKEVRKGLEHELKLDYDDENGISSHLSLDLKKYTPITTLIILKWEE